MGLDAVYPEIDVGLAKHSTVVSVAWGKVLTAKKQVTNNLCKIKIQNGKWNDYENGNLIKKGKTERVEMKHIF